MSFADTFLRTDPTETYTFQNELGKGSFGTVFKARRKSDGALFAIKVIPVEGGEAEWESLAREISVLRDCEHECIVSYIETYYYANTLWVVMEVRCIDTHTHSALV